MFLGALSHQGRGIISVFFSSSSLGQTIHQKCYEAFCTWVCLAPFPSTLALTVSLASQEIWSWLLELTRGQVKSFMTVHVFAFTSSPAALATTPVGESLYHKCVLYQQMAGRCVAPALAPGKAPARTAMNK